MSGETVFFISMMAGFTLGVFQGHLVGSLVRLLTRLERLVVSTTRRTEQLASATLGETKERRRAHLRPLQGGKI